MRCRTLSPGPMLFISRSVGACPCVAVPVVATYSWTRCGVSACSVWPVWCLCVVCVLLASASASAHIVSECTCGTWRALRYTVLCTRGRSRLRTRRTRRSDTNAR
eukprot:scaffold9862_cov118-Isochrysis_galbana.AAC.8